MITSAVRACTVLVGVVLVMLGVHVGSGVAFAHSALVSSTPPADGVLERSPSSIELTFNQDVSESFATIALREGADTQLEVSAPAVSGATVTSRVSGDLAPGGYTVGYRVVSADGHPITGQFSFAIAGAENDQGGPAVSEDTSVVTTPSTSAVAESRQGDNQDGSLDSNWIVVVVIVAVVLGLATIGGLLLFSARRDSDD
ncbi:copper resistance CopC family protein [Williamsia sp.]|uniref:copper resistance CopC family protein n=1 Tax=Williamsia sp. TaxID=1872085 RepID=UPI002F92DDE7